MPPVTSLSRRAERAPYGVPTAARAVEVGGSAAAGGVSIGADEASGTTDADAIAGLEAVELLLLGGAITFADGDPVLGTPDEDVGPGISSVLKGVGLSPSGIAPGDPAGGALLLSMFKSAAGGTDTEKDGS